jgi:metal-responsive CopG/Arc/MetJ family transcriptional regulator
MMTWYDDAMRTIIDLPEEQVRALADYCAREKVSRAEAVRRAVAILVEERERRQRDHKEALKAAFGIWKDRGIDAVEYQRKLRSEWDRE